MVVEAQRAPYDLLARATERLAAGVELAEACELLADAVVAGTGATFAVVRVLDRGTGLYVARAVAPKASALAAEASGSARPLDELLAGRPGAPVFPTVVGGRVVAAIELLVGDDEPDPATRAVSEIAAAQLGLVMRAPGAEAVHADHGGSGLELLERAGDTLAAGAEVEKAAMRALELVVRATGGTAAGIWRVAPEPLDPLAVRGDWTPQALDQIHDAIADARDLTRPVLLEHDGGDGSSVVSIRLGEPAFALLAVRREEHLSPAELRALVSFATRVAHALRLGLRSHDVEQDLERTRTLLSVVGEAIARLSLAHTLETAVERVADLLAISRVGIYLREEGRLELAACSSLDGIEDHQQIALALLELATGPLRARATIEVDRSSGDPVVRHVARKLAATGVSSAVAVPLRAGNEAIGVLVAFAAVRGSTQADRTLLAALASQLAVAVQNARLHEQATELGSALRAALVSERQSTRQLGALYEISSSFARSLSLETTLATVATSIVRVLDVDAAGISLPDERGGSLVPQAVHVADGRVAEALRMILERPQPMPAHLSRPQAVDVSTARGLGGAHALLVPFLEKGSTAALLPVATADELLAVLTIISLDPDRPIGAETMATATSIAAQAALAIDNARLYQQQKQFAETIQRALLPRERPAVAGLELGAVYDPAARVDVGGDLYDFLELPDGRLAVVLGDVTGHGVEATADMAMAKFVFRSLVREHPRPGDFLAHANEVVSEEIAAGKFITMASLTVGAEGAVTCASAGHPPPRVVRADGGVETLACRGLALGVDSGQVYPESTTALERGDAVVLFTDGVIEARTGTELYGDDRLDALLSAGHGLRAQGLAEAVLADCRAFAGGELADDCAVVVVRRS